MSGDSKTAAGTVPHLLPRSLEALFCINNAVLPLLKT